MGELPRKRPHSVEEPKKTTYRIETPMHLNLSDIIGLGIAHSYAASSRRNDVQIISILNKLRIRERRN